MTADDEETSAMAIGGEEVSSEGDRWLTWTAIERDGGAKRLIPDNERQIEREREREGAVAAY